VFGNPKASTDDSSRRRVYLGVVSARRAAQVPRFSMVLGTEGRAKSGHSGMASKENEKEQTACS
jgi:hypothetical protein